MSTVEGSGHHVTPPSRHAGGMDLNDLDLSYEPLAQGEDVALAKLIEAGVYAAHLLESRGPDPELRRVVEAGEAARERLWSSVVRIVLQQARRAAALHQLPEDDLFQDGCLAVAEAIRRYDHARGVRFTTFAYDHVQYSMGEAVRHRIGRPAVSRWDRRVARLAVTEMDVRRSEGVMHTLESASAAVGVPVRAVQRALIRMVSLEDAVAEDPAAEAPFEDATSPGLDFLNLLTPRDRRVLDLRFGLSGEPRTLSAVAEELGASVSTVHRWENEAIAAARRILSDDRTTLPRRRRRRTAA